MKIMIRTIAVIFFALIMLMSTIFISPASADYTAHGPIRINSNSEFSTMASSEGWTGSGTSSDPYIISGLEIDGTASSASWGIYIGNTTSYFTIQNCHIHNVSGSGASDDYFNSGIILNNVENGLVVENTLANNVQGAKLINSNNNYIYHNNFISNTAQAFDDGSNSWYDVYPSGGNYWSDWISPDADEDGYVDDVYDIPGQGPAGTLTIIFLRDYVGNGEGTLIISPSNEAMLIDAGSSGNGAHIIGVMNDFGISKLKHTVATHYHEDHIGSTDEVINGLGGASNAITGYAYDRGYSYGGAYPEYLEAVGSKRRQIEKWEVIELGDGVTLTCVGLNGNGVSNLQGENEYGLALRLDYGEFDAFFGGDLGGYSDTHHNNIESTVADDIGQVEVYQVDHHGSAYSSNTYLMETIEPLASVISCGASNPYGHPTYDAYYRIRNSGSYIYSTSEGAGAPIASPYGRAVNDDIVMTSDGQSFIFTNEAGSFEDEYNCHGISGTAGSETDAWPYTTRDGWITIEPVNAPLEPINFQASAISNQVTLTWEHPTSDGGSEITGYNLYRAEEGTSLSLLANLGNVTNYVDTDVVNGQTYYYQVRALNEIGEGRESMDISATPASFPSAPINLQATAGDGKITLDWTPPLDDGGSPVITFKIYRNTMSDELDFLTSIGHEITYTDTDVANGQTYYYSICATNKYGQGNFSKIVQATPSSGSNLPSAPLKLKIEQVENQVILSWESPSSDGNALISKYNIYRGTSSGQESFLVSVENRLSYTDTTMEVNKTYYYTVSAVNSIGEGASSTEVSFSTEISAEPETVNNAGFFETYWWLIVLFILLIATAIIYKMPSSSNEPEEEPQPKKANPATAQKTSRPANDENRKKPPKYDLSNIPPTSWER